MHLFHVPPDLIDLAWRDGAHKLASAIIKSAGECTADQLKALLQRGEKTLIGVREGTNPPAGWAVLEVQHTPNLQALFVYAVYAPGAAGIDVMRQIKRFARDNGCMVIRGACGDAVLRLWQRRFGAKPIYTVCEISAED
jgi:hypothetical protein